jgi:hypothetical protein
LTVDVTDNGDRGGDVDDVALSHENFLSLLTYLSEERFAEKLLVTEPIDAGIEVEWRHTWTTVPEQGTVGSGCARGSNVRVRK